MDDAASGQNCVTESTKHLKERPETASGNTDVHVDTYVDNGVYVLLLLRVWDLVPLGSSGNGKHRINKSATNMSQKMHEKCLQGRPETATRLKKVQHTMHEKIFEE